MKIYQLNFEGDLTYICELENTPIVQKLTETLKGDFMINNNHLKNNISLSTVQLEKSNIAKYSTVINITKNMIDSIDFDDRKFINRLNSENETKEEEGFLPLLDSIKSCGLLNPIYLFEKNEGGYIIVSGWRRSLALKMILDENEKKIWQKQAVIFRKDTPADLLEQVSIDENTKRKDLSILELSYKFNSLSEKDNVSLDECLNMFGIAKSQFYAIKKAIDFNPVIKEVLEEVGPIKSDYLDKILNELTKSNDNDITEHEKNLVLSYKDKTREELKEILQELKINNLNAIYSKTIFDCKRTAKKTVITIKQNISDEDYEMIQDFIQKLTKK
ncbi:MAG: ParB/RepB/Spo0J family partition protein [Cetobacterium sp.]